MTRLFRNKSGTTAIEYGLMIMLGALMIITATQYMGQKTAETFTEVAEGLDSAD